MSSHTQITSGTILCTVSGTVLTVIVNINSQDIFKTVVLAALGAVVSFAVSLLCKLFVKKLKR